MHVNLHGDLDGSNPGISAITTYIIDSYQFSQVCIKVLSKAIYSQHTYYCRYSCVKHHPHFVELLNEDSNTLSFLHSWPLPNGTEESFGLMSVKS